MTISTRATGTLFTILFLLFTVLENNCSPFNIEMYSRWSQVGVVGVFELSTPHVVIERVQGAGTPADRV